jgi:hypothetical protein
VCVCGRGLILFVYAIPTACTRRSCVWNWRGDCLTGSFFPLSHPHSCTAAAAAAAAAAGLISESSDGITYMQNLDALIEEAEKDWPKLQVCGLGLGIG